MIDRLREPRSAAVVGILLALAIIVFLLVSGGDDDNESAPAATDGPEAVSVDDLRDIADASEFPIYWAGERPGEELELTIAEDASVYVRYLASGTPIGSTEVASLTIGSYPFPGAYEALQAIAQEPGARTGETPDGGFVVTSKGNADSVYIAYPGSDVQIEVYDPDPETAFEIATSSSLEPIE